MSLISQTINHTCAHMRRLTPHTRTHTHTHTWPRPPTHTHTHTHTLGAKLHIFTLAPRVKAFPVLLWQRRWHSSSSDLWSPSQQVCVIINKSTAPQSVYTALTNSFCAALHYSFTPSSLHREDSVRGSSNLTSGRINVKLKTSRPGVKEFVRLNPPARRGSLCVENKLYI